MTHLRPRFHCKSLSVSPRCFGCLGTQSLGDDCEAPPGNAPAPSSRLRDMREWLVNCERWMTETHLCFAVLAQRGRRRGAVRRRGPTYLVRRLPCAERARASCSLQTNK